MKPRSFELKKDTVKFFYEVDSYWQEHNCEKQDITIQKLRPLYKGLISFSIGSHREFFLYRNPSKFWTYRLLKKLIPLNEYQNLLKQDYYRLFYDTMCSYYFKVLKADDIVKIHEQYKDREYQFLDDTFKRCG